MFLINSVQEMVDTGAQQLLTWVTQLLPKVFLFLILLNAVTSLIGRSRVERLAAKCGSNVFLRYLVLPFLSAVVLGNPMAISMGRYLPERYKPAYFASASYHCHTNNGIFQHINPAELFLWLGIANGVLARGQNLFPLALRYLLAGLAANFVSGYATELITRRVEKKQGVRLDRKVDLWIEREGEEASPAGAGSLEKAAESTGPEVVDFAESKESIASSVSEEGSDPADSRTGYHTITITRGDGGYGGPLTITPTEERHIVLYMTGGGLEPEPLAKIVALSGMEPVNGNQETCPDEEVALAIIDCGGTLRCGIYPGKGMYVSAVTSECVSAVVENVANAVEEDVADEVQAAEVDATKSSATSGKSLKTSLNNFLEPVLTISKVISLFQQSAREAVKTCLEMILPFMGFAALFIGICKGSGLTQFLAGLIQPMGGSLPGLLGLGIICSIPGLSAILGAGAVAAQMFSTVIGELIAAGSIPPVMALPALFAINCQCACDFIPVGLGMTEAKPETTQVGIAAITISRFATGWIRILIAVVFSIGLYR